ncbi:MAG: hypothetical protein C4522_04065 [Desulfobacteraceae bacterium]|nr:MAG: hypothetical protein C4522_04065 [Desulfobacteraceae bacterium]
MRFYKTDSITLFQKEDRMTDQEIRDEAVWGFMQKRLGYTDQELLTFRNNPRNHRLIGKAGDLVGKTVIFEVVESRGCNIEHHVGEQFFFSAEGYMLAHKGPKKVCPYIMPAMARLMWVIQERIYEGLDPRPYFYKAHCDDVGIECGGWGNIVIEAKIVNR